MKRTRTATPANAQPGALAAAPALVLAAVSFTNFLATFNETFLNVALAPIMESFGVGAGSVQWVTTAYMLVAAVMVPITGFLYRGIPTRRLFATALVLLLAGSLLGVAAPNLPVLIVARAVQALGTGMAVPLGMNLTLAVAPRERLGLYLGIVTATTTIGPALGPIVSGSLLAVLEWHLLFAVFAALVACDIALSLLVVPDAAQLTRPALDAASTTLASIALIGLMYGISTLFSGSLAPAVGSIAIGAICLVAFAIRQGRIAEPLIDLRPFSVPAFSVGTGVLVAALMTVFSMNIVLPLFMETALGFSPLQAALTLLPACILSCVIAPISGRIFDAKGLRSIAPFGAAVVAAFTFALSTCGANATSLEIVTLYAPCIAGTALVMGPAQSFALASLPRELHPHGVTIVSTSFQIAGCVGSSVFMGIMSSGMAGAAAAGAGAADASAAGFHFACLVGVAVALLGFAGTLALARFERARGAQAQVANAAASTR